MDRLIYTALSGATQTLQEQQISANNARQRQHQWFSAQDMAIASNDKVKGGGFDTRFMAKESPSGVNDSARRGGKNRAARWTSPFRGRAISPCRIEPEVEVTIPATAIFSKTIRGSLTIDGNVVLGDNGPIILPPNAIASFGSDGTLAVTPDDGDVTAHDGYRSAEAGGYPIGTNLAQKQRGNAGDGGWRYRPSVMKASK